jgi:hypothetical protein
MIPNQSRGMSRPGWLALAASVPLAALVWGAAIQRAKRPSSPGLSVASQPPAATPDDAPLNPDLFRVERCRLRTTLGPVTCEFGNRDDPGSDMTFGTAYVRFRWRAAGERWATNYLEPRRSYFFFHNCGVRLEATKDGEGRAVILVNVISPGGSGHSLLTTAVRLDPTSARPRVLGHFEGGEEPSGYIASPRRGTILFWSSYPDPNAAHVAPHTFSFVKFRIERDRWIHLWSRTTQRKYDWNLEEESRYLRRRSEDPLHEIGRRWPVWWTEKWEPKSSQNVTRY